MKKMIFTTIAAGFLAVSANAACYQIGTAEQLDDFAKVVNGGDKTACAELTADIKYQGDKQLVKDDLSGLQTTTNLRSWTPIQNFAGSFDGRGYTIKGLYATGTAKIGFVGSTNGNATIKNLNIVDSYFRAEDMGAGIVADVYGGTTTIDNCTFDGLVYYQSALINPKEPKNLGGLVGYVSSGSTLNLSNSVNKANVAVNSAWGAGLVGGSGDNLGGLAGGMDGTANISNCVTSGNVSVAKRNGSTYDQVVGNVDKNASLDAENISCVNCFSNTVKSGVETSSSLEDALKKQAEVIKEQQAAALANLPEATGVTFSYNDKNLLVATLNDGQGSLSVSEDIAVDAVALDRAFEAGVQSTIMLPFDIEASMVEGATFYEVTGITRGEDNKFTVNFETATATIKAHTPYLVKTSGTSIAFKGSVTLKATSGEVSIGAGSANWKFKGVYADKNWDAENNVNEIGVDGQVYGFSSKAVPAKGINAGDFVKAGKGVRVKAMRAYLYYDADPATLLAKAAASDLTVALEDLPNTVQTNIVEKEIVVSNVLEGIPGVYVDALEEGEEISSVEEVVDAEVLPVIDEDTKEENIAVIEVVNKEVSVDDLKKDVNEVVNALPKGIKLKSAVKSDRWFDPKGRRLGSKPSAHGVYINNKTPVVVK